MEQRVNIKFCFKLGKTAKETHEMLVKVYGVDAVSKKCIFEWFKRFRDGMEDVKDEPRSGRPPTSTTPDNIERERRVLADDRRLSSRMIAEELKISLDSVSNIITKHLQKRKEKDRNVIPHPHLRWTGKKVPYVVDPSIARYNGLILSAINDYHTKTCVRFVPRTFETNYIRIFPGQG
ncbi:Putative uncharacterized protein FLJ37770, partial [Araneus ventricosus]